MIRKILSIASISVVAISLAAAPAVADETIVASDNGSVECQASAKDLTRISLKDDQFAAVSKVTTGIETEDFAVVHEPTRGDIYISVPEGYGRPTISFFGTTAKGFVYKFTCNVGGDDAKQVFIANPELDQPAGPMLASSSQLPIKDQAVDLVTAMFEQRPVTGYEVRDIALTPVNVGTFKVQLTSEYRGLKMSGKILRIENTGPKPITVSEELVASQGAIAVSISNSQLQPGQATGAYVVVPAGGM